MFKSVGLVARYDKKPALKLTEELAEYLAKKGLKVFIEDTLAGKIVTKEDMAPLSKMKTDFIITIGGDGTILRTAITLPKPEPPILAINMGVRGFLTEVEPENAFKAVEKILKGDYKIEKSTKLSFMMRRRKTARRLKRRCNLSRRTIKNPLRPNLQRWKANSQVRSRRPDRRNPNRFNGLFSIGGRTSFRPRNSRLRYNTDLLLNSFPFTGFPRRLKDHL